MELSTVVQLIVSGLTIGCVYSLVGLGFSLTMQATDLVNFAQGELVMLGAFIGLTLVSVFHLPFVLVFVLTSLTVGVFGLLLERVVLRPIINKKSPLLNLLIATLGISIVLLAVAVILWGRQPLPYPDLFGSEPVIIFGIRVQPLNLWILGLGVALMIALQLFFQRTMTGISWRAAALDPNTASLYGVSRNKNRALTFGLSSALAGAAGVLTGLLFFASVGLGPAVLAKSFAGAAMGGFGIVGTMVGGLVMGVIETLAAGAISSAYKNVIMFGLLLLILFFRFRPKSPVGRTSGEGPKVVAGLRGSVFVGARLQRAKWVLIVLGLLVWLAIPLVMGTYTVRIFDLALIMGIAVLGLQLIVGFTGQFSFGHAAFYGIGAYTSALLTMKLGVPFLLAVPAAMVMAGLAGFIVAPLLRLSGHYLAIGTLALGEIIYLLMVNLTGITNGAYGLYGIPSPKIGPLVFESTTSYYFLASVVLAIAYFFTNRLTRSRFGRGLVAVRENELTAVVSGVDAFRAKTKAFVIGTALAGLAGSLFAHFISYISPEAFHLTVSTEMLTMVVIGGLGSLPGGIVGALVVVMMPEYLRFLADYRLVVYGLVIITFMLYLPGGLADLVRKPIAALMARRRSVSGIGHPAAEGG